MSSVDDGADVVVCCGSGGVGKTTVAAAITLEAARRGRRVVVVTIDPARRLADALGLADGLSGHPQRIQLAGDTAGKTAGERWAMMLDTPAMFERVVRANAADEDQANRILQNRFYRNMTGALSGTQEFMASEALYELHADQRFDLVVVDTPPSRNALDFLEAPGVLARLLEHPVFKLLMLPTRTGFKMLSVASQPIMRAIGRVVGSDALADASAFFQAFAGMEAGFRDRAEAVTRLLHADATRFVLVASPRSDTVDEAVWFTDQLVAQGFAVGAIVVNRVHPRFGDGTAADADHRAARAAAAGKPDEAALWSNLAGSRRLADAEHAALDPLISRAGGAQRITIPLLAEDIHDLAALDAIANYLNQGPPGNVAGVHILIATDADWIVDDVTAALGGPDTTFTVCRDGRVVSKVVKDRTPDLAILDLQVGSMGGMATAMALRLDESGGLLPHVNVLMLLDRAADVYLAQRSGADGWIIKPLDAMRLARAARTVIAGNSYTEGVPAPPPETVDITVADPENAVDAAVDAGLASTPEEEPAPAG